MALEPGYGLVRRSGTYGQRLAQVEKLHACRAPPEHLLAQEGVEVDAAQAGLLVALAGGPARFVVGHDQVAVVVHLQTVDNAPEAQTTAAVALGAVQYRADVHLHAELGPHHPDLVGVLQDEVVAHKLAGVGDELLETGTFQAERRALVTGYELSHGPVQLLLGGGGRASAGLLLPHQQLQGPVHHCPLERLQVGRLRDFVNGGETERQGAFLERGDFRRSERARQLQRHWRSG